MSYTLLSEKGQIFDGGACSFAQTNERLKNALVFKGLSFCEAYVEGRLRIAMIYRPHTISEAKGRSLMAVIGNNAEAGQVSHWAPISATQLHLIDSQNGLSGDEKVMLISNIEPVNSVEFTTVFLEGLYDVKDMIEYGLGGLGSCFLSIGGSYRILPSVPERKLRPLIDSAAVGFNQNTVCVIKGTPEVMDCVTDDSWRIYRQSTSDTFGLFPITTLVLSAHSVHVLTDIGVNNAFELVDVMVGPFYF
ncbi:MAG: hypothetical protein WBQ60_01865 [Asticcacaulis sp.]